MTGFLGALAHSGTPAAERPSSPTSPICCRTMSSRLRCRDTRELEYWEAVILAYWHYSPRHL